MKVQESLFIRRKKPLVRKLLDMLLAQYPYASILAEDAKSGNYNVSRKSMAAGEGERGTSRGFVAKVSDGKHYIEYSFNRISEENLDDICDRIRALMEASDKMMPEGLCESVYEVPAEEKTEFSGSTDY